MPKCPAFQAYTVHGEPSGSKILAHPCSPAEETTAGTAGRCSAQLHRHRPHKRHLRRYRPISRSSWSTLVLPHTTRIQQGCATTTQPLSYVQCMRLPLRRCRPAAMMNLVHGERHWKPCGPCWLQADRWPGEWCYTLTGSVHAAVRPSPEGCLPACAARLAAVDEHAWRQE